MNGSYMSEQLLDNNLYMGLEPINTSINDNGFFETYTPID